MNGQDCQWVSPIIEWCQTWPIAVIGIITDGILWMQVLQIWPDMSIILIALTYRWHTFSGI